ncbi:CRISPR-associated endonuclease Cas2 [Ochrobactrum sp. BD22]|jgi:CRISPR/Cas system-associated endoribonuclease Cas2|nr:CRISPR-associated endonuclease Cas2 [Ochrobactrum sp. AP1BH01-1]
MSAYVVAYDLKEQGQNYDCIIEKIKSYGTHWHMQKSVWIVVTSDTSEKIYNKLQPCLDDNDRLFVGELTSDCTWSNGYGDKVTAWLTKNL